MWSRSLLGYCITSRAALVFGVSRSRPPSLSIPLFSTRQSLTTRIHRKRRYGTALRRPAQKQLVYLTIVFTCCLVHDTWVNHQVYLSKHVCPNPSQLLISELIREMYYRFNCQRERWTLPFLHTRRACDCQKKRPSSCHPLQTSSSQGSISQPVLSEIKGWELFLKNAIRL